MTWNELIEKLNILPHAVLETEVTILFNNEVHKINGGLFINLTTNIFESGRPYLLVDDFEEISNTCYD